jgi:hypothetical protein
LRADGVSAVERESSDPAGNARLHELYDKGFQVVRYVNVFEHPGSISLKVVPSVIRNVRRLPIPMPVNESEESQQILANYIAERDTISADRPSIEGISKIALISPTDPETASVAEAHRASEEATRAAQRRYRDAVVAERLSGVGYQTRKRLTDAVGPPYGEIVRCHKLLIDLAGLVSDPTKTIAALSAETAS